jgi:hypothetical protein
MSGAQAGSHQQCNCRVSRASIRSLLFDTQRHHRVSAHRTTAG